MKKKILELGIVAILIVMLVTLTGCGSKQSEKNNEDGSNVSNDAKEVALYPVKDSETGKFGYVDNNGKWVIEPKYTSASGFDSETGLAKVWTSNKDYVVGFINKKGELVIEDKYGKGTKSFYNGYAVIETENKGGSGVKTYNSKMLIDKDQNVIIPDGKYTRMTDVSKNGIVGVVYDAGMQYIKLDGTLAFDKKFGSNGTGFNANGIAAVETAVLSNEYILIDEQGNQIGEKYGEITKLNDNNYGFAKKSGNYAIINENGELLSDAIYYDTSEFNNSNVAMVQDTDYNNPWYLINSEGKKINDTTYKSYSMLLDGKWVVTLEDGKHQVLNADGSILVDTF